MCDEQLYDVAEQNSARQIHRSYNLLVVAQREFAKKHLQDDPMFKLVSLLYTVVPDILLATGKVSHTAPFSKLLTWMRLLFFPLPFPSKDL